jgi:Ras-related protein Rab-7A
MSKQLQKIIILGAQGVGKTSLMERFVAQKFSSSYKATIGADFSTKDVTVGNELITLQIWDTAGQERYQSLGTAFYRGADACVLVYDVSDANSFAKLETWRTAFIQAADVKDPKDFPFVVMGNKADLEAAKHVVQPSAVAAWCDKHGKIPSFLVSRLAGFRAARDAKGPRARREGTGPRAHGGGRAAQRGEQRARRESRGKRVPSVRSGRGVPPPLLRRPPLAAPSPPPPPPHFPSPSSPHAQVSAKTGDNVETAFVTGVKAAAARVKEEEPIIPEALKLDAPKQKDSSCAC